MGFRLTETKPMIKKYKGKPEEKIWKQKDTFYKLLLNSTSGLLDNEYSWLFNNTGIMKVRCGGQLILMWLIEQCVINNIDVISANTDGIEVKLKKDQLDLYDSIIKSCEDKFDLIFESEIYQSIIYASVNSYVAITESGQIKQKGADFITNPELGNSTDMLVYAKALNAYFIQGIKPEEFIISPDLTIFDFCLSQKVSFSAHYKLI